jgi:protease-4
MKKFFVRVLAMIGGLVVVVVVVAGITAWAGKGRVPAKTILEVDFEKGLVEYVPDDPVAKIMMGKKPTVRDVAEALERASTDRRVVGLVARVGEAKLPLAQIQEVRDAVMAFRSNGKKAIALAETFSEDGPSNGSYYLATAFDEIYMQPSGDLGLTGLLVEVPFIRGTLDKLGFVPRMDHRYEYKSAMNRLTERKFTAPHREAIDKVMQSYFAQMVKGIAQARHMTEDEMRALIDRGPFLGREAVDAKLVDGLAYRDELYERVKGQAGKGAKFLYLSKYLARAGRPHTKGETIALIYGAGGVQRGTSGYDPIFQDITMGSDTIAAAFRAAVEDKKVKAIIFRVDSPGGSYVASDTIWRETVRARKAGKPVIVSMGALAGSGGYFVSMAADKIVAQPATITGSIGVVAGKFISTNFWDKLGISWDEVHTSSNALMFTGLQDYTPEQWEKFQQWLDRVYVDFTTKVAEGRHLPKERVLEIAKGRIWSGEDAKAIGLVDELGGFPVALRLAREAAGLAADAKIRLKEFPEKKSPLKALLAEEPDSSEPATAAVLVRALEAIRPAAALAKQAGLVSDEGLLRMPQLESAP